MHSLRVHLRLDHKLCRQQTLRLILSDVRSIRNIGDELRPKRQHHIVAIDVSLLALIYYEQIVAALTHAYVGVFAHLDIAFHAQNE